MTIMASNPSVRLTGLVAVGQPGGVSYAQLRRKARKLRGQGALYVEGGPALGEWLDRLLAENPSLRTEYWGEQGGRWRGLVYDEWLDWTAADKPRRLRKTLHATIGEAIETLRQYDPDAATRLLAEKDALQSQ